jgi:hypothetical protein
MDHVYVSGLFSVHVISWLGIQWFFFWWRVCHVRVCWCGLFGVVSVRHVSLSVEVDVGFEFARFP